MQFVGDSSKNKNIILDKNTDLFRNASFNLDNIFTSLLIISCYKEFCLFEAFNTTLKAFASTQVLQSTL